MVQAKITDSLKRIINEFVPTPGRQKIAVFFLALASISVFIFIPLLTKRAIFVSLFYNDSIAEILLLTTMVAVCLLITMVALNFILGIYRNMIVRASEEGIETFIEPDSIVLAYLVRIAFWTSTVLFGAMFTALTAPAVSQWVCDLLKTGRFSLILTIYCTLTLTGFVILSIIFYRLYHKLGIRSFLRALFGIPEATSVLRLIGFITVVATFSLISIAALVVIITTFFG